MRVNLWEWKIGKSRPIYELILWYLRQWPGMYLKEYLRQGIVGHTDRFVLYTNDDGITFDLDLEDYLQKMIFCYQYYEQEYVEICKRFLPVGGVVLDVGANIGQYSLIASKRVGPTGHVYAFEPGESILSRLRRNIELNPSNNIEILPVAVGNDHGFYSYYPAAKLGNQGVGSLIPDDKGDIRTLEPVQVKMVRLNDFCEERGIKKVDFIKIDVEGFEFEVLKGSGNILSNNPNVLLMVELANENLKAMGTETNDIKQFMLDMKFRMYTATGRGRLRQVSMNEDHKSYNVFFIR
jgi:FkbM family methyltransferase